MIWQPRGMNVLLDSSSRIDRAAIEDPNGPPMEPIAIPDVAGRMGGPTAPVSYAGGMNPQVSGVVVSSRAPKSFAPHDDLMDAYPAQQPHPTDRRETFQDPRAHVVSGNRR